MVVIVMMMPVIVSMIMGFIFVQRPVDGELHDVRLLRGDGAVGFLDPCGGQFARHGQQGIGRVILCQFGHLRDFFERDAVSYTHLTLPTICSV